MFDVVFQEGVITDVDAKLGPIIGISKMDVISVLDIHVPTHEPHLKMEDSGVAPIIG